MDENKDLVRPTVEQKRIRGRNIFDVVYQIVNEYNSSNGWALVKISPNLLNLEVIVERSTAQTNVKNEDSETKDATNVVETKAVSKPATKTSKKPTTQAKNTDTESDK